MSFGVATDKNAEWQYRDRWICYIDIWPSYAYSTLWFGTTFQLNDSDCDLASRGRERKLGVLSDLLTALSAVSQYCTPRSAAGSQSSNRKEFFKKKVKKGFVVLGHSSHRKDALKVKWLHSLSLLYLLIQFCLVTKSVILVVGLFPFF